MAEEKIDIPQGEVTQVPIYYTNDLHGEMENFGRIATILRKKKKEGENFLLFDAGDFAAGTPVANMHKGKPMVELFNITDYDAISLGESELMFDTDGLQAIIQELKSPVVCSNLFSKDGELFPGLKSFIIKNFQDINFAVIGLITPKAVSLAREKAGSPLPGLDDIVIKKPEDILPDILSSAKAEGAHRFILLSHLGVDQDALLAEKFSNIDVIISAHSHSYLAQPVNVKDTLIVSSGMGGKYLGSLTLNMSDVLSMKISKNK